MNKSTFCILPFVHLEARSDGFVAPCCMAAEPYKDESGFNFHLSKNTLDEVWNSKSIKDLRDNLLSGVKDTNCASCWTEESFGRCSRRMRENENLKSEVTKITEHSLRLESPTFLDLKLGNTCNLRCRICSPGNSSSWVKEWKDVNGSDLFDWRLNNLSPDLDRRDLFAWPDSNPKFWEQIEEWLPTIKSLEFYGGEPFLIRQHFELLKRSVRSGYSKDQSIRYSTNGSIFPEDAVKNIWPHFKNVNVMMSIDGTGIQYDYQRHPAKWVDIVKNIQKFKKSLAPEDLQVCLTVSALNVYYVPDYIKHFYMMDVPVWLNVLYDPSYFSIKNLPYAAKQAVLEKWSKIGGEKQILTAPLEFFLNYMSLESDKAEEERMLSNLKKHDAYRNEKYSDFFPEFSKFIGYN